MQIDKREKVTVLFIASWVAVLFLAVLIMIKYPNYTSEKKRLTSLKMQLSDSNELENRMNAFINAFKERVEAISADIADKNGKIAMSSFSRMSEIDLPGFVDALPKLVASTGVKLDHLGYKPKETIENFIEQSFEITFSGKYAQIRQLLHALETHPAGIRIEMLEFVTLDDSNHEAQLRLNCQVRFAIDG